jgi:hypothetical protein
MEQATKLMSTPLTPNAVNQFIENQRRELEIRADELHLRAQDGERAFVHARRTLEAGERDRKDDWRLLLWTKQGCDATDWPGWSPRFERF